MLELAFSQPAKLVIDAVGFVFWQAKEIASNDLLSLAEKVLGICISETRGPQLLSQVEVDSRSRLPS